VAVTKGFVVSLPLLSCCLIPKLALTLHKIAKRERIIILGRRGHASADKREVLHSLSAERGISSLAYLERVFCYRVEG